MSEKKYILSATAAQKKINRMALEVAERNYNEPEILLVGIKENGLVIARRVAACLREVFGGSVQVLELSMDKKQPGTVAISPEVDYAGKNILLVDDVANSGRTMLYALAPLLKCYPAKIQTLALVERTHKTFPVEVDYVGLSVSTTLQQHIYVEVTDGEVVGAWME